LIWLNIPAAVFLHHCKYVSLARSRRGAAAWMRAAMTGQRTLARVMAGNDTHDRAKTSCQHR
jgi:hypothetical protein